MILEWVITIINGLIGLVLSAIPALPAMSTDIVTAIDATINSVRSSVAVMTFIFSAPLVIAIFATALALMSFEYAYISTMWVLRKIGILNIR
jgi:hypothetical protein